MHYGTKMIQTRLRRSSVFLALVLKTQLRLLFCGCLHKQTMCKHHWGKKKLKQSSWIKHNSILSWESHLLCRIIILSIIKAFAAGQTALRIAVMNLQKLLHPRLINMLQAVKTHITVDLIAECAGDVAKSVTSVTFRLLFFRFSHKIKSERLKKWRNSCQASLSARLGSTEVSVDEWP